MNAVYSDVISFMPDIDDTTDAVFVWDQVVLEIPPGTIAGFGRIEVDPHLPVGTPNRFTEKSVFLTSISITDATLKEAITVTLPFDISTVVTGDFEEGRVAVYHAENEAAFINGENVSQVDIKDIFDIDYPKGLVRFQTRNLSVFAVGSADAPQPPPPEDKDSDGSSSCFIRVLTGAFFDTFMQ